MRGSHKMAIERVLVAMGAREEAKKGKKWGRRGG